jgi:hypothetical protein
MGGGRDSATCIERARGEVEREKEGGGHSSAI